MAALKGLIVGPKRRRVIKYSTGSEAASYLLVVAAIPVVVPEEYRRNRQRRLRSGRRCSLWRATAAPNRPV